MHSHFGAVPDVRDASPSGRARTRSRGGMTRVRERARTPDDDSGARVPAYAFSTIEEALNPVSVQEHPPLGGTSVSKSSAHQLHRLVDVEHGRIHNEAVPLPGVVLAVADPFPGRLGQPWDVKDSLFGAPAVLGSVGADDFHLYDTRSGVQSGVAPGVTADPNGLTDSATTSRPLRSWSAATS